MSDNCPHSGSPPLLSRRNGLSRLFLLTTPSRGYSTMVTRTDRWWTVWGQLLPSFGGAPSTLLHHVQQLYCSVITVQPTLWNVLHLYLLKPPPMCFYVHMGRKWLFIILRTCLQTKHKSPWPCNRYVGGCFLDGPYNSWLIWLRFVWVSWHSIAFRCL